MDIIDRNFAYGKRIKGVFSDDSDKGRDFAGDSAGHRYNVGCRIGDMRLSGRFSLQENFFAPFLGM